MYKDKKKPKRRLKPKNYPKSQKILQLKLKTYNTTLIKNIGNLIDIERPTNINNTF